MLRLATIQAVGIQVSPVFGHAGFVASYKILEFSPGSGFEHATKDTTSKREIRVGTDYWMIDYRSVAGINRNYHLIQASGVRLAPSQGIVLSQEKVQSFLQGLEGVNYLI